jgi:hypothetical protein
VPAGKLLLPPEEVFQEDVVEVGIADIFDEPDLVLSLHEAKRDHAFGALVLESHLHDRFVVRAEFLVAAQSRLADHKIGNLGIL